MVEEELEFPLEDGCTLFKEVHNSITLEPTYEGSFTILREVHDTTSIEPSYDESFTLYDHLGDLVHSSTSRPSISCNIH